MAARDHAGATASSAGIRCGTFLGNVLLVAWLAYLLIAPTIGLNWIESWHNEQRATQIVLLAATAAVYILVAALQAAQPGPAQSVRRFPSFFFVLIALGIASALRAPLPQAALAEVGLFTLLALLAALTSSVVAADVERAHRWARWFSVLFAWAYVLGVATRYLAAVNLDRSIDLDVLILGYANPRFPSAFHTMLIPFLVAASFDRGERGWMRIAALVSLCFLWAINLGLGTRGIWFAYAIGLPISMTLLGWNNSKRFAMTLVLSCMVGILLYAALFRFGPATVGHGTAVSSPLDNLSTVTSREVLWQLSWKAIRSSPLLGIGPMQFAGYGSAVGAHPHNWLLQVGAEWGLVALAALLWGLLRLARGIPRARDRTLLAAPLTAVLAALAQGLVDGNLVMPLSQTGFFLVLGTLVGSLVARNDVPRARLFTAGLVLTCTLGAAAATFLPAYALDSYEGQPTEISRFRSAHPGMWLVPRFWEQGSPH